MWSIKIDRIGVKVDLSCIYFPIFHLHTSLFTYSLAFFFHLLVYLLAYSLSYVLIVFFLMLPIYLLTDLLVHLFHVCHLPFVAYLMLTFSTRLLIYFVFLIIFVLILGTCRACVAETPKLGVCN